MSRTHHITEESNSYKGLIIGLLWVGLGFFSGSSINFFERFRDREPGVTNYSEPRVSTPIEARKVKTEVISRTDREKADAKLYGINPNLIDYQSVCGDCGGSDSEKIKADLLKLVWPAHGRLLREFYENPSNGIEIALDKGTPIKAAYDGQVLYVGHELKGYGNAVSISHKNGFLTIYANTSKVLVREGDRVVQGQQIAESGASGNVSEPQLHFELRKDKRPLNPLSYF
jgi:murein DD-endopeptidase MepM/ murein hydrolase activator NlpD